MEDKTKKTNDFLFIRFPAAFVRLPCFKTLSVEAKYLYSLLLDRLNLSISNKWKDNDGQPYVIYSIESVMDSLGCSKTKAIRTLDTLEEWNLIRRVKQGLGKPNHMYVLDPSLLDQYQNKTTLSTDQSSFETGSETDPVKNDTALSTDRSEIETGLSTNQSIPDTTPDQSIYDTSPFLKPKKSIFETQEVSKMDPNKTNYNKTNYNKTEQEQRETKTPALVSGVMNQNAKEILCQNFDEVLVRQTTNLLYELVATPSQHVRINNTLTSGYTLSQHLANISVEQIQSALNRFTSSSYPAAEQRDYLLSALYDAAKENRTA